MIPLIVQQAALVVICMALMVSAIVFLDKGKEPKNKSFMSRGWFCALGSIVISIIFGNYFLAFMLLCTIFVIAIYLFEKVTPSAVAERIKVIENTDISDIAGPMRFKDVFAWYFRFKLERKYGAYKAALIYTAIVTGILSVFILPFCLLGIMPVRMFVAVTTAIFGSFLIFYWQLREGQVVGSHGTTFL